MNLAFIDSPTQMEWAKAAHANRSATIVVAITAEAMQALEQAGIRHEPISSFVDTTVLASAHDSVILDTFRLCCRIEKYVAERCPSARFDGPGPLTGQAYFIQHSVQTVAYRAYLMAEALRQCAPETVTVFQTPVLPWFQGDGLLRNPWVDWVEGWSRGQGFRLDLLPDPPESSLARLGSRIERGRILLKTLLSTRESRKRLPSLAYGFLARNVSRYLAGFRGSQSDAALTIEHAAGLNVLCAELCGYDWGPVTDALTKRPEHAVYALDFGPLDGREFTYHYSGRIRDLRSRASRDLGTGPPVFDEPEAARLGLAFDEWVGRNPEPPELKILGMNLLPALAGHLRHLISLGPALIRHADTVAGRALDLVKPDVVIFLAACWLTSQRFSHECRTRGIPVVAYQHGGCFLLNVDPTDEQRELANTDYMFTYGEGVRPPETPSFPVRCKLVPVGSTRIEALAAHGARTTGSVSPRVRVLFTATSTSGNTVGGLFVMEDTRRYLLEKRVLEILGSSKGLDVTYRPYPGQELVVGTCRWIRDSGLPVRIDAFRPMAELVNEHDVVVQEVVGTPTNEIFALGKPLILYGGPPQKERRSHYDAALAASCRLVRSEEELIEVLKRLAHEGPGFLEQIRNQNDFDFVADFVLHRPNRGAVQRVLDFLESLKS